MRYFVIKTNKHSPAIFAANDYKELVDVIANWYREPEDIEGLHELGETSKDEAAESGLTIYTMWMKLESK